VLLSTLGANVGISVAYAAIGAFALDMQSFMLAFAGAILVPALAFGVVRIAARSRAVAAPPDEARSL
jgi:hypothetical protein